MKISPLLSAFLFTASASFAGDFAGTAGLQLYSLRDYAPKDLPGTLARLRGLGIVEVESAGLYDKDVAAVRAAFDKAGLKCQGAHIGYDTWQKDAVGAVKEAKGLGARFATCAWIKGEKDVTRDDILRAAGKTAR